MEPSSTIHSPKRRAKFLAGGLIVVTAVGALLAWAMTRPGSTAFYLTPSEVHALGTTDLGRDYRVNGTVVPGSIQRDGLETTFAVTDGKADVTVLTNAPLPDTFRARSEVVAKGRFD